MHNSEDRVPTIRSTRGFSRRQLLAAGAGAAGAAAGAGLIGSKLQTTDAATLAVQHDAVPLEAPVTHGTMSVVGSQQGTFKSDRGSKNIALLGVAFELNRPVDPSTGLPTGQRMWKPVTVTKPISVASPQLLEACVRNETLTDVTINFWRPAVKGGALVLYWTIKLSNATIIDVSHYTSDNENHHLTAFQLQELEDIQFVFQKITVTNVDGKTTANDDWVSG